MGFRVLFLRVIKPFIIIYESGYKNGIKNVKKRKKSLKKCFTKIVFKKTALPPMEVAHLA